MLYSKLWFICKILGLLFFNEKKKNILCFLYVLMGYVWYDWLKMDVGMGWGIGGWRGGVKFLKLR